MKYQVLKHLKTKSKLVAMCDTLAEAQNVLAEKGATYWKLSYIGSFPIYTNAKDTYSIQGFVPTVGVKKMQNKIKVTHLGEDYATVKIGNEEFQTSLGLGEALIDLSRGNAMCCPMCDTVLTWTPTNPLYKGSEDTTHIYVCPECPFIGFEYYTDRNIEDLKAFLNK